MRQIVLLGPWCVHSFECLAEVALYAPNDLKGQKFHGDSGGGLMSQLDDGRWVLLGINSSSSSLCRELLTRKALPTAQGHTNVAFYAADIARFTDFFLPLMQV
ncbi:unnamed protein product [Gongylonema pulchrum]|uniref:Peptidase S1 domain-containing protein n=1 Tax=Gongylonema pulchrum TaxID=637853 RepID=A0A183EGE6_9BILA|nr:unnamed protein product [Gongylonema pulchrum]